MLGPPNQENAMPDEMPVSFGWIGHVCWCRFCGKVWSESSKKKHVQQKAWDSSSGGDFFWGELVHQLEAIPSGYWAKEGPSETLVAAAFADLSNLSPLQPKKPPLTRPWFQGSLGEDSGRDRPWTKKCLNQNLDGMYASRRAWGHVLKSWTVIQF